MERYTNAREKVVKIALGMLAAGAAVGGLAVSVKRGTYIPIAIEAPRPASADCEGPPPRPDLDACGNPLPTATPTSTPLPGN